MSCNYPVDEARELCCSAASALITKLFYAIFVFLFAVVGATLGAMTGAFVGAKTETGCLRGAMAGAIKGSFLSVNLFKISLRVRSSDSDMATTYFLQPVNALESTLDDEVIWNEGMPKDSMAKIPKKRIKEDNVRDSFRNRISCSICLEDITPRETVHSLPYCRHMFHSSCIQQWLADHKSCPLCRRRFRS
ncbi:ABA-related RING-type E3 ligase, Arabidopsis Toxicos en Levadura 27 [Hibiscus trionum]|uniref:ABA-related RING-type E3 ligase, Arabidopsis Toxicos en Levadura 27 n=1 Tax=Hibiscus trionum TaxID=183268 RepID=A0A9W7HV29_HIBTR|nr:ABA-related RING-type E3 ligase, Arabidopsis Toxicos en Levadura 27 [Hibiscus trionum]